MSIQHERNYDGKPIQVGPDSPASAGGSETSEPAVTNFELEEISQDILSGFLCEDKIVLVHNADSPADGPCFSNSDAGVYGEFMELSDEQAAQAEVVMSKFRVLIKNMADRIVHECRIKGVSGWLFTRCANRGGFRTGIYAFILRRARGWELHCGMNGFAIERERIEKSQAVASI